MRIKFEAHFVFDRKNAFRFSQPSRFVFRDLSDYKRYNDDSFFGPNSYLAKRQRYLEELREKVSKGWRDPEIVVSVESEFYHPVPTFGGLPKIRYYVLVAVKVNSVYDCGRKKRNLLKYYSASHLDECGNPMDYDVIWESKEIEDCKNGDIATLKKRKEVIEFLEDLRKVEKVENIKQENNLQ